VVGRRAPATARTRMPDTRMSEVGLETLDEVELAPTASASQHTLQSSRSATPGDQAPEQDAKREAGTPHVPREREAWSSWLFNENGSLRAKAVLAAGTMVLLLVMVAMMIQNTNPLDSDPFKGRAAPFSGVFFGVGIAAFCAYNYYRYGQTREAITRSLLPTSAAPSSSSSRRARAGEQPGSRAYESEDDEIQMTMAQIHSLDQQIEGLAFDRKPGITVGHTRALLEDIDEDARAYGAGVGEVDEQTEVQRTVAEINELNRQLATLGKAS